MKLFLKLNPVLRKIQPRAIRQSFGHFGRYLRPHWRTLFLAGMCTLGATATQLLQPWPIKLIFDVILAPQAKEGFLDHLPLFGGSTGALLAAIVLSILLIAVIAGLCSYGEKYLTKSTGQKVVASIRRRVYSHIQRLSRSFHDAHHSGDLMTRLTSDIGMLQDLMVGSVLFLSENLLVVLGMVTIMLWMDWQLTLVALGILPALTLVNLRFSGKIKSVAKKQRHKEGQIAGVISEVLSRIAVVQAFTRERYEGKRFSRQNKNTLKTGLKATRLEASLNRLIEIIVAAGTCVVLWLGVKKVLAGVLTPGDLLVFTAYLRGLYRPIRRLAGLTSHIAKASACGERVISILETESEIKDSPDAIVAPPFRGEIIFEEVDFWYHPGEPVLNAVSFTVKSGQKVVLLGPSGVGKSTILDLLLRFYDPRKGRILIDGTDIRRYTLASLRDQLAIVLQESLLFGTTIRENIAYGKLDATVEEIEAAAKAANAHDFIMEFKDGYDTTISERGNTLSGGQKQRIAIARAIIRNAPILVLDEPMTGLDVESEAKVRDALKHLMAGKTCLLITHALQAAAAADLVLVLEEGRIVECGEHSDLMGSSRQYRQLYNLRIGEHEARNVSMEEV